MIELDDQEAEAALGGQLEKIAKDRAEVADNPEAAEQFRLLAGRFPRYAAAVLNNRPYSARDLQADVACY